MNNLEQIAHITSHEARDMIRKIYEVFGSEFVVQAVADRTREIDTLFYTSPALRRHAWAHLRKILVP